MADTDVRARHGAAAGEDIVGRMANLAQIPLEQTRITCSPSVAAIVQLVRDGYGVAAIAGLFVLKALEDGEFVELPVQPEPPHIIVAMCFHANADMLVHKAANDGVAGPQQRGQGQQKNGTEREGRGHEGA